jgi:RND family efflux transporter MFP subunit
MNMNRCLGALLVVALVPLVGCTHRHGNKPRLGEVDRLPHLEVVNPEKTAALTLRRGYVATVDAFEKADLSAQVRGVVTTPAAEMEIGRAVTADEPLVRLAIPDVLAERDGKRALLDQAKRQLEQARQAREVAAREVAEAKAQETRFQAENQFREAQYTRVARLASTETVAPQLVDEARLQRAAAQAAVDAARAQVLTKQAKYDAADTEIAVAQARIRVVEAELERLEATVRFATLSSPFPGVITRRWVDRGTTVKDPGVPLLTVMRTDRVRVILDLPERDVPYLTPATRATKQTPANPVELIIPALKDATGGGVYRGVIDVTASALDPTTRTMRAEVHLDNRDGLLKPQMTGTATVTLAERSGYTVPSSALVRLGDKIVVFHVADISGDPPVGVTARLEVQLGLDDGERAEVVRPELTGREQIIVKGNGVVQTGQRVIAVPVRKAEAP